MRRKTRCRGAPWPLLAGLGAAQVLEGLDLHGGVDRRRRLALELDNLVVACHRAVARGDGESAARTCCAVAEVLLLRGPLAPGIALSEKVIAMAGLGGVQRAAVLSTQGAMLQFAGRMADAEAAFEQALAGFHALHDQRGEAQTLRHLGSLRRNQGRLGDASRAFDTALALARATGHRRLEGELLGNLGIVHAQQGRLGDACAEFERALAIHRDVGNRRSEANDTNNLGNTCREQGRLPSPARTSRLHSEFSGR